MGKPFFPLQTRGFTPFFTPAPSTFLMNNPCDYQSLRYKSNNSMKRWTLGIIKHVLTNRVESPLSEIHSTKYKSKVFWLLPQPYTCHATEKKNKRAFISQQCPAFMFAWRGAILMWGCCRDPRRFFYSEAICSGHISYACQRLSEIAWNACQTCFFCVHAFVLPSSSFHPQRNWISLWHGLNFPHCGTFFNHYPSILRLS